MILAKLFNHGQLKNIKVENGKLVFEGTYGKEEFTDSGLPAGGSTGQVVTKTSEGAGWSTPNYIPDGGTAGQVLTKYGDTDYQAYWGDSYQVPTNGSIGQYLKKYGEGDGDYAWADIPAGGKPDVTILLNISAADTFFNAGKINTNTGITAAISTSANIRDYLANNSDAETYLNKSLSCRLVAKVSSDQYFVFDGSILFNVNVAGTEASIYFHGTGDYNRVYYGGVVDRKSYTLALSGNVAIPTEGAIVLTNTSISYPRISETTIEYVAST